MAGNYGGPFSLDSPVEHARLLGDVHTLVVRPRPLLIEHVSDLRLRGTLVPKACHLVRRRLPRGSLGKWESNTRSITG